MFSRYLKVLMASSVIASQLITAPSAKAEDASQFKLAEKRLIKAKEHLGETDEKIKKYNDVTPSVVNTLTQQWNRNWRAYDRKRASQGIEADLLNQRLRDLRDKIGVFSIQLSFAKHQIYSAESALNALNFGDNIAPRDELDLGKEVRIAKRAALQYRLSLAENQIETTRSYLKLIKDQYEAALTKIKSKVREISVFHPEWNEVVVAQNKLTAAVSSSAIGKITMVFEGEKSIAHEHLNEANYNFLVELLDNKPVLLEKFDVSFDGDPWYITKLIDAENVAITTGEISPELRIKAYGDVQKRLKEDIQSLEFQISDASQLVTLLGAQWQQQANIVLNNDNEINQTKVNLMWVNLGVEMSFATMSILASGGMAATQYAPELVEAIGESMTRKVISTTSYVDPFTKFSHAAVGKLAKGVSEATQRLSSNVLEATAEALANKFVTSASKITRDYYKEQQKNFLIGSLEAMHENWGAVLSTKTTIAKLDSKEYFLADHIELSGAQSIIIGDVLESVVTNVGFDDAVYTGQFAKAFATNNLKSLSAKQIAGAGSAGIAIASTTIKVVNQLIVDELTEAWQKQALIAGTKAGVYKVEYYKILNVRNAMQDELAAKENLRKSVKKLIDDGPKAKKLDIISDRMHSREEFDQLGGYDVKLRFSRPIFAPTLISKGIVFYHRKEADKRDRDWVFYIDSTNVPDDAEQIEIEVKLNRREPYGLFDSNPETPVQLVKIDRDGWSGYEPGSAKHTLRIDPRKETIIGMNDIFYAGDRFLCERPKLTKVSGISDEFDLNDDFEFYDVDINRRLATFEDDETIKICVNEKGKPTRDSENRVIATASVDTEIYKNGYRSTNLADADDGPGLLDFGQADLGPTEKIEIRRLEDVYDREGNITDFRDDGLIGILEIPIGENPFLDSESQVSIDENTNAISEIGIGIEIDNLDDLGAINLGSPEQILSE